MFPQPYGERIYVTWYAVSVFFIPLIVLIFTHFYICREIWVNVSLKRKTDKREKQTNNRQKLINNGQEKSYSSLGSSRKCLLIGIDRVVRLARRSPRRQNQSDDRRTRSIPTGDEDNDCLEDENGAPIACTPKHSVVTFQESSHTSSPRVNTVNRLSRAKIKTVKITVVVIFCYILCSSPFIFVQLWAYWVPSAQLSSFWTGRHLHIKNACYGQLRLTCPINEMGLHALYERLEIVIWSLGTYWARLVPVVRQTKSKRHLSFIIEFMESIL